MDNRLRKGYIKAFASKALDDTWVPVSNVSMEWELTLMHIEVENREDQPNPHVYGGSEEWADNLLRTVDRDNKKLVLLSVANAGEPDFLGAEAEAVMRGYKTEYGPAIFRGQSGGTLIVKCGSIDNAVQMAEAMGDNLTNAAKAVLANITVS